MFAAWEYISQEMDYEKSFKTTDKHSKTYHDYLAIL